MTTEFGVPTRSVLRKPLSSQSLFDNKFWCLHVTIIGDLGLDLIHHQVNPMAEKNVQHFRNAAERLFCSRPIKPTTEAQGYTKVVDSHLERRQVTIHSYLLSLKWNVPRLLFIQCNICLINILGKVTWATK